ncbi:MAG: SMI1/KNR4 family protein [Prochloraceae cyanobacterium]
MDLIWHRIEAWLKINAPEILNSLQSGASEQEIEETEAILGVEFPAYFKASYLIHNGLEKADYWIVGLDLLSLEEILEEWQELKDCLDEGDFDDERLICDCQLDRVIKTDYWWNYKWIPVTKDNAGNYYCLDLDPDINGNYGQIITFWHDSNDRELIAVNFRSWLEKIAADLENGVYIYDPKYKWLEPVDL